MTPSTTSARSPRHDIDVLMSGYAEGATMLWVGGPLDGTYSGQAQLRELWGKFAKAQGPLEVAIAQVQENGNPQGRDRGRQCALTADRARPRCARSSCSATARSSPEVWQIDPAMPFQQN
jgi:hypothetical protein